MSNDTTIDTLANYGKNYQSGRCFVHQYTRMNKSDEETTIRGSFVFVKGQITKPSLKSLQLKKCDLKQAVYSDCTFKSLSAVRIITFFGFRRVVFTDCNFREAKINNVDFNDSKFRNCTFKNTKIKNTVFDGCSFKGCDFEGATLNGKPWYPTSGHD